MIEFALVVLFCVVAYSAVLAGCGYHVATKEGHERPLWFAGMCVVWFWTGAQPEKPVACKDVYRWVQLRPDSAPFWLLVAYRYSDGRETRCSPAIPEILWSDGLRTPAR